MEQSSKTLNKAEKASHSWIRWIFLIAIVIGLSYLLASTFIANRQIDNALPGTDEDMTQTATTEEQKIDTWIKENNLNEYGDPSDTGYTGGTPLFNEGTGDSIDRYEYIIDRHPDKPWNK